MRTIEIIVSPKGETTITDHGFQRRVLPGCQPGHRRGPRPPHRRAPHRRVPPGAALEQHQQQRS